MANEDDGTSTLRSDCTLYLFKSLLEEETKDGSLAKGEEEVKVVSTPQSDLTKSIQMRVGGIAGLGSTEASAKITLDRNKVHVGDKVNVRIEMNNKDCAKPVKSFKFKLKRVIKCFNRKRICQLEKEEYLIEIKEEDGCEAKVIHQKDYAFDVPTVDQKFGKLDTLHPELR